MNVVFKARPGSLMTAFKGMADPEARKAQSALMYKTSLILREKINDTFKNQADPWGQPWKDNTEVTKARKRRLGLDSRVLVATGALFKSIRTRVTGINVKMSMGEGMPYFEAQQFGNPKNRMFNKKGGNRAPIVQRRMLPLFKDRRVALPRGWWDSIMVPWYRYFDILGRR